MDAENDRRTQALRRLWAKRAFKIHAALYVTMSVVLLVIWAITSGDYFWPVWPITGAALGLMGHAWIAFGLRPIPEDVIQEEMAREPQKA